MRLISWLGDKTKKFGNTISNIGNGIKRGVKQAGKWTWDHREGIGKVIGAGLDVASSLGVPGANIASKVVKGVSNVGKALGEDKFSKGIDTTLKKKNKSEDNNYQPSSAGYSLSTRNNLGTKEGFRVNSWKH